jgi:hypothetical protein
MEISRNSVGGDTGGTKAVPESHRIMVGTQKTPTATSAHARRIGARSVCSVSAELSAVVTTETRCYGAGDFTVAKNVMHASVTDPNTASPTLRTLGWEEAAFDFGKGDTIVLMTEFVTEHQTDAGVRRGTPHARCQLAKYRVAVEKLFSAKFAKTKSRQNAA